MSLADRIPGFSPTRRAERLGPDHWRVYVKAPAFMATPETGVSLTEDQYQRYLTWRSGKGLIQHALPDLTPSQREILMSGLED